MKKAVAIAGMVVLTLTFATPVLAQHGGSAGGPATSPPGAAQMDPGMCASMMAMHQGAAQQGGMQHGAMPPGAMRGGGPGAEMGPGMMMGMMASADPATMQMRGEIMKALGEIMMKYGKAMEKPAR